MEPSQARLTLFVFLLLSAGIVFNALHLQADPGLAARTPVRATLQDGQPSLRQQPRSDPIVLAVKRELNERHYFTGRDTPEDDAVMVGAIMAYQYDHHLDITGVASDELLKTFLFGTGKDVDEERPLLAIRGETARRLVAEVQGILSGQGYYSAEIDGLQGAETAAAIRRFEAERSLPVTGRISGQLVQELTRATGIGFSGRVR